MGTVIARQLIIVPIVVSCNQLIINYFNKTSGYRNTGNVVALNFKPSLLFI